MKLATYRDGSRDGQLVVVSRDLRRAHLASGVAGRLQQVLDDWNFLAPQLQDLSDSLNSGRARHAFDFDPGQCMAPLPRAYQWVDASAYPSHGERLLRARGAPPAQTASPVALRMYQGGGDYLLGPREDIVCPAEDLDIDFEAELGVITGDVPMDASPEQALEGIRLFVLLNDVSLRALVPAERDSGFGFVQSKPATAFAPVAVTPDEIGTAWRDGRLHLSLAAWRDGRPVGQVDTAGGMAWHAGELVAHLARTRRVRAGSIVGFGTASSADPAGGCLCIGEQRALEVLAGGEPSTGWLRFGEVLRIEARDEHGRSVFGTIEQRVAPLHPQAASAPAETAPHEPIRAVEARDTE